MHVREGLLLGNQRDVKARRVARELAQLGRRDAVERRRERRARVGEDVLHVRRVAVHLEGGDRADALAEIVASSAAGRARRRRRGCASAAPARPRSARTAALCPGRRRAQAAPASPMHRMPRRRRPLDVYDARRSSGGTPAARRPRAPATRAGAAASRSGGMPSARQRSSINARAPASNVARHGQGRRRKRAAGRAESRAGGGSTRGNGLVFRRRAQQAERRRCESGTSRRASRASASRRSRRSPLRAAHGRRSSPGAKRAADEALRRRLRGRRRVLRDQPRYRSLLRAARRQEPGRFLPVRPQRAVVARRHLDGRDDVRGRHAARGHRVRRPSTASPATGCGGRR